MNTEKLEKLKKSLDNKFIPDNMKDKIRAEIKKLEADIKTDETITATEVKEEVKEIEEKVEKALEVAEEKQEKAKVAKAKTPAKRTPRKTTTSRTKSPKVQSKVKSSKKSIFSIAKEIRKDGESWEESKKRASEIMKSGKTETKKKVKTETQKLLASIRRKKELKGLTGTNIRRDINRPALPKGKRISKNGKVYYEYRDNRTDRLAPSFKDKIYLAEGGGVGKMKKPRLKKGDNVVIIGQRWFDRANGNTYHTALVLVNGQSYGKSEMTYGYDNAYVQTGKERLLKFFDLPRGMKETAPLWQLPEFGVQFMQTASDGLKRDLAEGGALTNERRHVNKSQDYEVRYAKNKPSRKGYKGKRSFAGGGGIGDNAPQIYVADLQAYNNGKLVGQWFNLLDYNDADELMEAIQDMLKESGGEEYAVHDYENLPRSMYSEYMGEKDFEEIYQMIDLARDKDLPLEVVMEVVNDYGENAVDEFYGVYDSEEDFAEQMVDDLGIEGFNNFEYYLEISDLDRRLLAQDMADSYVNDIRDEDGGNRLIEEAGLDVDEYEEADSDRQEEMLDEAREIVYDEYYDTWYEGLDDPYYFLVEEQGIYSPEDFANASFVRVDTEKLARDLEQDYTFIRHDGQVYVFSIR